MKVAIAGASGLVGSALVPALRKAGHDVLRLVRQDARAADEIKWDPATGTLDQRRFADTDAVINLAGENIGSGRWTTARRHTILQSRVAGTRTLVDAMEKALRDRPVLLNASAVGYYGDRGEEVLTEESASGDGFLPEVCRTWEMEAERATRFGARVVRMRFGMVVAAQGGALARMLPLFRLGLGGRMGSGEQWMSWIGIDDVVGAILHALPAEGCAGPFNFVAPGAVRNAEFANVLAMVLGRPAVVPTPGWALRIAVGNQMAGEALLVSQRATPARLAAGRYQFRHPTLDAALRATLL